MKRLWFILCFLPLIGLGQSIQRQFFTTNTAPNVVPTAGSNAFVTFSLVGQERRYRIDVPASGAATNVIWPIQGTNVFLTTNGFGVTIDVPTQQIPWQNVTNIASIQIPWQVITNIASIQIPYSAITNPPAITGQTNLALVVAGTNVFVTAVTNSGVTTFTIDVPITQQTNWSWQSITNIATVQIPYAAITNPPSLSGFVTTNDSRDLNLTGSNTFNQIYVAGDATFGGSVNINSGGTSNWVNNLYGTNFVALPGGVFIGNGSGLTNLSLAGVTNAQNLTNWALLSTNTFLNKAGDTSTGPQLTTSSTSNAPSATEFATAGWVRSLLNNGFFEYASTNIISGTNADSPNQFLYGFQNTIPQSAVRVWASAFLTNNGYVGSVATTNTFQSLAGSVVVNAYMGLSSGGGDALSIKPEIYLSTDRSNWYGDFDCQAQALTPGRTNLYTFVITFPAQTATNAAGFYVERRLKVTSVGGTPTLTFMVGTNTVSGTNNASHMVINAAPVQGGTFSGTFIGDGSGLTNQVVTVSTLPAAPVPGKTVWASDVLTSRGTGDICTYDGSVWRTRENIIATANLTNFVQLCASNNAWAISPIGSILSGNGYVAGVEAGLSTLPRFATGGGGSATTITTPNADGGVLLISSGSGTTGNQLVASYFEQTPQAGDVYACGGIYSPGGNAAPDGTDNYWCLVGFSSLNTGAISPSGVYFLYDRYTNTLAYGTVPTGATSAWTNNWLAVTAKSGTGTNYTDTGLPATIVTGTATTSDRLLVILTTSSALFYTNGSLATTLTSNLPAVALYTSVAHVTKTAGSNSRKLYEQQPFLFLRHAARRTP